MTHPVTRFCITEAVMAFVLSVNLLGAPANDYATTLKPRSVDLTGFYVEGQPFICGSAANVFSQSPRVLLITHRDSLLRLSFPHRRMVRLIHIERPDSARLSGHRKNGLARWDGDTLTVETRAPAFPLWGHRAAELVGSTLTESFITAFNQLTYRSTYTPPGVAQPLNPLDVSLVKCGNTGVLGARAHSSGMSSG